MPSTTPRAIVILGGSAYTRIGNALFCAEVINDLGEPDLMSLPDPDGTEEARNEWTEVSALLPESMQANAMLAASNRLLYPATEPRPTAAAPTPIVWRVTPAGAHVASRNGEDVGNVYRNNRGQIEAYLWAAGMSGRGVMTSFEAGRTYVEQALKA